MSIENITLFRKLHAEPSWLQDLRKKLLTDRSVELPAMNVSIPPLESWRWDESQKARPSANVPDFTALDSNLKLVQVGNSNCI